jgi:hypothetical protein
MRPAAPLRLYWCRLFVTGNEDDIVKRKSVERGRKWTSKGWRFAPALAVMCALGGALPAHAGFFKPATGKWCALEATGLHDCSYATYEQCMATLSGIGGTCSENLQAPPDAPPPRYRPSRHKRHRHPHPHQ